MRQLLLLLLPVSTALLGQPCPQRTSTKLESLLEYRDLDESRLLTTNPLPEALRFRSSPELQRALGVQTDPHSQRGQASRAFLKAVLTLLIEPFQPREPVPAPVECVQGAVLLSGLSTLAFTHDWGSAYVAGTLSAYAAQSPGFVGDCVRLMGALVYDVMGYVGGVEGDGVLDRLLSHSLGIEETAEDKSAMIAEVTQTLREYPQQKARTIDTSLFEVAAFNVVQEAYPAYFLTERSRRALFEARLEREKREREAMTTVDEPVSLVETDRSEILHRPPPVDQASAIEVERRQRSLLQARLLLQAKEAEAGVEPNEAPVDEVERRQRSLMQARLLLAHSDRESEKENAVTAPTIPSMDEVERRQRSLLQARLLLQKESEAPIDNVLAEPEFVPVDLEKAPLQSDMTIQTEEFESVQAVDSVHVTPPSVVAVQTDDTEAERRQRLLLKARLAISQNERETKTLRVEEEPAAVTDTEEFSFEEKPILAVEPGAHEVERRQRLLLQARLAFAAAEKLRLRESSEGSLPNVRVDTMQNVGPSHDRELKDDEDIELTRKLLLRTGEDVEPTRKPLFEKDGDCLPSQELPVVMDDDDVELSRNLVSPIDNSHAIDAEKELLVEKDDVVEPVNALQMKKDEDVELTRKLLLQKFARIEAERELRLSEQSTGGSVEASQELPVATGNNNDDVVELSRNLVSPIDNSHAIDAEKELLVEKDDVVEPVNALQMKKDEDIELTRKLLLQKDVAVDPSRKLASDMPYHDVNELRARRLLEARLEMDTRERIRRRSQEERRVRMHLASQLIERDDHALAMPRVELPVVKEPEMKSANLLYTDEKYRGLVRSKKLRDPKTAARLLMMLALQRPRISSSLFGKSS